MYEDFYKFRSSPFRLSPDPSFFFASSGHKRALAYLRYGLNRREGFIVVTGSPGTGKTTLARSLLQEVAKEKIALSYLNTTQLEADDVLRMVAASFGLEHENQPKASVLKRLETFFLGRLRAGEHVLIVIDEAQNLPRRSLEELRMLSNFQFGNHALVQIFLLGQQQFKEVLNAPDLDQLRQRVVAACHLQPLSAEETRGYIEHRLAQAGWAGDPCFSNKSYAQIFRFTEGVPRRINSFCDRLLLFSSLEELHEIREETVRAVYHELSLEGAFGADPVAFDAKGAGPELEAEIAEVLQPPAAAGEETPAVRAPDNGVSPTPEQPVVAPPESARINKIVPEPRQVSEGGMAAAPAQQDAQSEDLPDVIGLALGFFHTPKQYAHVLEPDWPLPEGIGYLLELAVGRAQPPANFRGQTQEIREAARNFIKQVMLAPHSDHYRLLGLGRAARPEDVIEHYQLMFRLLQPDRDGAGGQWSVDTVTRVNHAYKALREPPRKRPLEEPQKAPIIVTDPPSPPADPLPADATTAPASEASVAEPSTTTGAPLVAADPAAAGEADIAAAFPEPLVAVPPPGLDGVETVDVPPKKGHPLLVAAILLALIGGGVAVGVLWGEWRAGVEETSLLPAPAPAVPEQIGGGSMNDVLGTPPLAPRVDGAADTPAAATADTPVAETEVQRPVSTEMVGAQSEIKVTGANVDAALAPPVENKGTMDRIVRSNNTIQRSSTAATEQAAQAKETPQRAEMVRRDTPKSRQATPKPAAVRAPAATPKVETAAPPNAERIPAAVLPDTEPQAPRQVAKASPPPKPAKKAAPRETNGSELSDAELGRLLQQLTSAYESGDIGRFMGLFSHSAFTNDQINTNGIREDYEALFKSTSARRMEIDDFAWVRDGQQAQGEGHFRVLVRGAGDSDATQVFQGTLVIRVAADNKEPQITGLYHTYMEASN